MSDEFKQKSSELKGRMLKKGPKSGVLPSMGGGEGVEHLQGPKYLGG